MPPSFSEPDLLAYRLVAPKWAATAMSGEGARLYGGRWNSPGRPMVYLSTSRALAALELLVHLTTPGSRRIPRTMITARVPQNLIVGEFWKENGWQKNPPGKSSTDQGDNWLAVGKTAGVLAPSTLIPEEHNLLLNPLHENFGEVQVVGTCRFYFDSRLSEESPPCP